MEGNTAENCHILEISHLHRPGVGLLWHDLDTSSSTRSDSGIIWIPNGVIWTPPHRSRRRVVAGGGGRWLASAGGKMHCSIRECISTRLELLICPILPQISCVKAVILHRRAWRGIDYVPPVWTPRFPRTTSLPQSLPEGGMPQPLQNCLIC